MGVLTWRDCQVQSASSIVFLGSLNLHLPTWRHISKNTHHYVLKLGGRVSIPVVLDKFAHGCCLHLVSPLQWQIWVKRQDNGYNLFKAEELKLAVNLKIMTCQHKNPAKVHISISPWQLLNWVWWFLALFFPSLFSFPSLFPEKAMVILIASRNDSTSSQIKTFRKAITSLTITCTQNIAY